MIENQLQADFAMASIKILKKALKAPVIKGIPKELEIGAREHIKEFIKEIEMEIAEYKKTPKKGDKIV